MSLHTGVKDLPLQEGSDRRLEEKTLNDATIGTAIEKF